ncbi:MAG TPA: hypothetical protein VJT09_09415 [Pyrinomonadaceae bacterium]|nr:hypothetical protein [Pyrinomonadaceae bacterium]
MRTTLLLVGGCVLLPASQARACSRVTPFSFSELFAADVIVRVTADEYVVMPDLTRTTNGVPDSIVEFKVEETLKGEGVPESIQLNAYLSDKDDFNDVAVPYKFVRPGGRSGSCFANTYKRGAQFLLFLKRSGAGYTSYVSPLGPVNEQLRSEKDPWLLWVKVRLNPCGKLYEGDAIYEKLKEEKFSEVGKEKTNTYRMGKCYIEKYGAIDDGSDQYLKYIKRWVEKYEKEEEQK